MKIASTMCLPKSAEAVRRTCAPQGFICLLLQDLGDTSRLIQRIDLDHPFFREFRVEASVPMEFAPIGLSSVQLALDYGDPANAQSHKHADFVFNAADTGPKVFTTFLNDAHDTRYTAALQFHFDPQSGWVGDRFSYDVPAQETQDRTLFVNPYEHVEFREIIVQPGEIDWELVQSIEVRLQATGFGAPAPRTVMLLTAQSTPQSWRLRGARPAPADRGVAVVLVQTLKDGTREETAPQNVDVPVLVVNDLFADALQLVFVPAFDTANVTTVFVDIEYADPDHAYNRRLQLELPGNSRPSSRTRIPLRDKDRRQFRTRYTFVGPGGTFDQRPWVDRSDELLAIQ